jgi:hypothetical protein
MGDFNVYEGIFAKGGTADISEAIAHGIRCYNISRYTWEVAGVEPVGETARCLERFVIVVIECENVRAKGKPGDRGGTSKFLE